MTAHEQGNHHVGNLEVGYWYSVFVRTVHQVPNHILFSSVGVDGPRIPPLLYDIHVDPRHLTLGCITFAVVWQWQPAKLEVNWDESTIKIVEKLRKTCVEFLANFFSLQRAGRSVDSKLRERRRDIENPVVTNKALRWRIFGEERPSLGGNELDVRAEGGSGQAKLNELQI